MQNDVLLYVDADLDRTLLPNGPQPESPAPRHLLQTLGCYVSA
jgi:hypothetical protein